MIATLYNVFKDAEGLNQFSFANADLHLRTNSILQTRFGRSLSYYVLDPIAAGPGVTNWLQAHQDIHNQVNAALGIAGNDLTDVDFNDPDQLSSWIWLHAQEHLQAAYKLGLS